MGNFCLKFSVRSWIFGKKITGIISKLTMKYWNYIMKNNSLVCGRAQVVAQTPATERVTHYCTWRPSALTTRPQGQVTAPLHQSEKFSTQDNTFNVLFHAKSYHEPCIVLPLWGQKPQLWSNLEYLGLPSCRSARNLSCDSESMAYCCIQNSLWLECNNCHQLLTAKRILTEMYLLYSTALLFTYNC